MRSVEFSLQILKKSNEETAAATPQRELECSSWTVQQAQKWADENGLKFLLGPYDQFSFVSALFNSLTLKSYKLSI